MSGGHGDLLIGADPNWRTHPVPILYGFESYASFPIALADGRFWGTLCAIDTKPRTLSAPATLQDHQIELERQGDEVEAGSGAALS